MPDLHYHISAPGPRSRYILAHMLGTMSGLQAVEVTDARTFSSIDGPKLHYGPAPIPGSFHVRSHGALERTGVPAMEPDLITLGAGLPGLFPVQGADLAFDPFAGAFHLLSRYEEYGPIDRDRHGRPVTDVLHAARHGYLDRPVVDEWLLHLWNAWSKLDPRLPAFQRKYRHVATLDVDNGFKYLGRPLWRSLGAAVRDLLKEGCGAVAERWAVLRGHGVDPYDVHGVFVGLGKAHADETIVNYLVAPRGPHDHAVGMDFPAMRAKARDTAARVAVGLHPGYGSSDHEERIVREKHVLEQALGCSVLRSRQHFLRFRLPETFRCLERLGIREEHSMGLADRAGFRAGTCTPFPFYDLHADAPTDLMLHPFAVMDSALCYKERLSPEQAIERGSGMVQRVKAVQGTFIGVWHERFLSDHGAERGWRAVVESIIKEASP